MKQKHIFARFMAATTDLVITMIPILVWDLIILLMLAGFLPARVMTFLDDVIVYVILVSFCVTNPFITFVYGKSLGQMVFDIRIVDVKNKPASTMQKVIRAFLSSVIILLGYYVVHGVGILVYVFINFLVMIADKKARGILDFACYTKPIYVMDKQENTMKKKPVEEKRKEVLPVLEKGKSFYPYDLHVHSKYSIAGVDTVEELFQKAKALNIQVLSITDQFSVKANFEAEVLSQPYGIEYIPGVEFKCEYKGYILTVLGYGIDYKHNQFVQMENEHVRLGRAASAERIEKFKKATGIDLNFSKLVNQTISGIVTGDMIIEEVLKNPLYEDLEVLKPYREENGFQRLYMDYFAQNKPCYVKAMLPSLQEVIEMVKLAGGISVLAYPKRSCGDDDALLQEIMEQGLDGIEIFSSYHNEEDIQHYLQFIRDMGCFVSSGSDYFGENKLMIQIGDTKANEKYEKILRIMIDRCLKKRKQMAEREEESAVPEKNEAKDS